jgi:hypothetical protein
MPNLRRSLRATSEPKQTNSRGHSASQHDAEFFFPEDNQDDADPDADQDADHGADDDAIEDAFEDDEEDNLSVDALLQLAQESGAAARLSTQREKLLQDGLKILHSQKDKMDVYCTEITSLSLNQEELKTLLRRYRLQPQKVSLPGPTDEIKIASY